MKHSLFLLSIIIVLLLGVEARGQVPRMLSHQGYLTNISGKPLDTTLTMNFRFFLDSTGGTSLWEQSFAGVGISKGIFKISLGPVALSFDTQYWLEVQAGNQTITPRTRLTSAAYALRADTADHLRALDSLTLNGSLISGGSSGTTSQVLMSQGAGLPPIWGNLLTGSKYANGLIVWNGGPIGYIELGFKPNLILISLNSISFGSSRYYVTNGIAHGEPLKQSSVYYLNDPFSYGTSTSYAAYIPHTVGGPIEGSFYISSFVNTGFNYENNFPSGAVYWIAFGE
ncbi:MAG: hypothetical protein EPO24_14390 [Bacteroidetes bacterium]|nr:MAG: hypothetical protein EPO24_14390 [Bacteroidota bacterium]